MDKNQYPKGLINNNYSPAVVTLNPPASPSPRPGAGRVGGIRKSPLIEISRYSQRLLKSPDSKELLIINSKMDIKAPQALLRAQGEGMGAFGCPASPSPSGYPGYAGAGGIQNKSSYYAKVDMLTPVKEKNPSGLARGATQTLIQKYLKSFTTLDIELAQNQNTLYEYYPKTLNLKILNTGLHKILEYSFFEMSSVISTPYVYVTPKNVIINLFYLVLNRKGSKKNFLKVNLLKLEGLSTKLSKYFKKPIKLELTQLYSVSNNSKILVNILGKLGLLRRNSFTRIIGRYLKHQSKKIFFRNNHNTSSSTLLTGINIKLGGRLMRGKIVPRRTVKNIQYGSLARGKSNYITTARLTQKNKRGSFSFTVSMGHKFF